MIRMQLISTYVRKVDGEELKYISRKQFITANYIIHKKRNLYIVDGQRKIKKIIMFFFQFMYVDT